MLNSRIQKLLSLMENEGIDTAIITDPKNMHYYSGFYNGEGYVVISSEKSYVVTDFRYTEYAQDVCKGFEVCDISKHKPSDFTGKGRVGFEDRSISYGEYKKFSEYISDFVPLGNIALLPREIKDSTEIANIKKAVDIADGAFSHICKYMKKGMSEKEVAAEIDCYMKKNGAEGNSFSTIVAAGERGSLPHAHPSDRKLESGDLVVMDYGCVVGGYCSDMTRTVAVGDISDECANVYDKVLFAQKEALAVLKAGLSGKVVDAVARGILDMAYPGAFGHSLGHSVGLDIHENPNLSPKNENPVCVGNVITVEPGVYLPGKCGVRIEDLTLVTENGCEIFTNSPKNLIFVG